MIFLILFFSVISSDRQSDYYTIIASPFSSSSLSYSSSITYVVIFFNSSSAKLFFDSSSNEYYVLFSDFKSYNCVIKYSNGSFAFDDTASSSFNRYQGYYHCSHYDYSGLSRIIFSTNNVYSWSDQASLIFSGSSSFHSPVIAQFDFKSDIEFFCCLNGNASALPVDNRVWIEVYDTLVAVETLDPSVNGSGQDISEFDFNSDFSTDLTQGAGLVRTLFDKIIQSAGLSGFMITVLSVAVVGWFIFGSRR